MSSIETLQILGVRSFDHQHPERIKFFSPLTLIVGANGSGKTTIIESLKYVTTGLQPPNTKGGAFIHDPKLVGEKECLAQVKLQFRAANGSRMVTTRNMSLTVNKAKRTQKTLEGNLVINSNGERTSVSSRVAQLDSLLPQHLGVSTAVLDNVIFCHQDEGLWPMSDSATLKKKFDEIFEALKYTRAVKNIKDIRKDHSAKLTQFKLSEQHAKADKERATKTKAKIRVFSKEQDELRAEILDLDKRIKDSKQRADQAWTDSESYARIIGALEGKKIEVKSKQNIIAELQSHLKEVPESDEWIETTLAQFEQRLSQYEEQKRTKRGEYDAYASQLASGRSQLNQKLADRGKDEQEKAAFDRDVNSRKRKVREIAGHQRWREYDDLTDDSLVDEFMRKIRRVSKDQKSALERARSEADSEKREAQSLINRLFERRKALRESKQEARQQMATNDGEAEQYQRNVDKIATDEGSSAVVESKIELVNGRFKKAQDEAANANWDTSIGELSVQLRSLKEQFNRLDNELIQGTKRAGETARLGHLKQEYKDRQRSLKTMRDAHGSRVSQLIGNDWQPATIEQVYLDAVDEATKDASTVEKARDVVARELEHLQYKQRSTQEDLESKKKEAVRMEKEVREAIDNREPSEYQEALDTLQTSLNDVKANQNNMEGLSHYFEQMRTAANHENPACRACTRPFKGPHDPDLIKFHARIEMLIERSTAQISKEEIDELEQAYQQALNAGPAHQRWVTLTETEIPSLTRSFNELSQQREDVLSRIEDHDKIVEQKQAVKKDLGHISRTVASIGKFNTEITTFKTQIADLAEKQSQHGGGRTLEDIQEEKTGVSEKMDKVNKNISNLNTEKEQYRTQTSSLELELKDLRKELSDVSHELEKKASLVARVEEYKTMNLKQRQNVGKIDTEIEKLDPEIATAHAKYDDIADRAATKEKELQDQTTQISQSLNALELLNSQIKTYVDRDGPNQLANTNRDINHIEHEMKRLETEQTNITVGINNIAEQLRDSENTRRQYSDNLRYRQETRALKRIQAEIEQLETQNAHAHRDRYVEESSKLDRERGVMEAKRSRRSGEMGAKDGVLQDLLQDFNTDLTGAHKGYRDARIKVETTKAAVEDLGRYGGALDKAIMKYHSMKMDEINSVLEDLWRDTYQGTDIDTILIKSESESAAGTHSYNYRVCMVKQDVEMDMRGRCSAGQKVLACILIRIALAECFSTNCGLITLDEPTTNLDSENIHALARGLHKIIRTRQQQANFQLIVITHDEEFLKQMRVEDFTDFYYRVYRSATQKSQIEKQSIGEVI